MIVGAILLCTWLTAGSALAENDDLEEGIRLYEALEYEPAQAILETALTKEGSTRAEIARAALYLGVVRVALGDASAGSTWFTVALAYDDTLQLPEGISPKIREQFDALAAKLTFARPIAASASVPEPDLIMPKTPAIDALVNDSPPPSAAQPNKTWLYAAGGATLLATGAALTFGILSYSAANEIESRPHERAELQTLQDKREFRGNLANAFLATAGALAATTVVVYLVQRPGKKTLETPPISVSGSADGAIVGTWFSF